MRRRRKRERPNINFLASTVVVATMMVVASQFGYFQVPDAPVFTSLADFDQFYIVKALALQSMPFAAVWMALVIFFSRSNDDLGSLQ